MSRPARRAALCVPASEPRKITKAFALDVDEVIIDLEDSVAPAEKEAARSNLASLSLRPHGIVAVRINSVGSPWWADDLAACAANPSVVSVVVPKVESADELMQVISRLDTPTSPSRQRPIDLQALIESPRGLVNVHTIAGAPRVSAIILGYADLAASLGRRPEAPWQFAQDALVLAARVHGVQAVDGPELSLAADDLLVAATRHAESLGFDGKWVIHPQQVSVVQTVFTPTRLEIEAARRILHAMEHARSHGQGATQLDGRMLDEAVAQQAQRVLSRVPTP